MLIMTNMRAFSVVGSFKVEPPGHVETVVLFILRCAHVARAPSQSSLMRCRAHDTTFGAARALVGTFCLVTDFHTAARVSAAHVGHVEQRARADD